MLNISQILPRSENWRRSRTFSSQYELENQLEPVITCNILPIATLGGPHFNHFKTHAAWFVAMSASRQLEVSLGWSKGNLFSLGSQERYTLEVKNNEQKAVEAQDVILKEDTYRRQYIARLPRIEANQKVSVDFTTEIKERVTIKDLPYQICFTLASTKQSKSFVNNGLGKESCN